jgi:hypothetical protein
MFISHMGVGFGMSILVNGSKERIWKCFECGWEYPYDKNGYLWGPEYTPICPDCFKPIVSVVKTTEISYK